MSNAKTRKNKINYLIKKVPNKVKNDLEGGWFIPCAICGEIIVTALPIQDPRGLSLDHLIPRSFGGSGKRTNFQLTHRKCNGVRGNNIRFTELLRQCRRQSVISPLVIFMMSKFAKHRNKAFKTNSYK